MTEECMVGDVVTFTSKRFGHNDKTKIWFVIEKTNDNLALEADDSQLIELSPPRGKHRVTIPSKYLDDCEIIKKLE